MLLQYQEYCIQPGSLQLYQSQMLELAVQKRMTDQYLDVHTLCGKSCIIIRG